MRIIFTTISIYCMISCTPNICADDTSQSIVGEWQLVEQSISSGGPQEWMSVDNGPIIIFNQDNTYEGLNASSSCTMGTFEVLDMELTITQLCTDDMGQFNYSLRWECGDFILVPRTIICVEGCSFRYQKII